MHILVCHRNARELLDYPCEVKLPLRVHQLTFFRWAFVVSYAIIAGLATAILMTVTDDGGKWVGNLALDAFLLIIFLVYARNAHKHNVRLFGHNLLRCLGSHISVSVSRSPSTRPPRSSSRTRASSPSPASWPVC